jgi:hypothetical protein
LDIYWNILTMHGPINVKSRNNISKWQVGFNSAFKGLIKSLKTYFGVFCLVLTWTKMFYIKLYTSNYKIQCVRKKVFASRKAPFSLCVFLAGFIGNREKKTTVFNQSLISKYKINFQLFIRHGSFVLLSLHFICLLPVYLVKDKHLRKFLQISC